MSGDPTFGGYWEHDNSITPGPPSSVTEDNSSSLSSLSGSDSQGSKLCRKRPRRYPFTPKPRASLPPSLVYVNPFPVTPQSSKGMVHTTKVTHQMSGHKDNFNPLIFDGTGDFEGWYNVFLKYREAGQWDDDVTLHKLLYSS